MFFIIKTVFSLKGVQLKRFFYETVIHYKSSSIEEIFLQQKATTVFRCCLF